MSIWADMLTEALGEVHATFGHEGTYTPSGGASLDVTARFYHEILRQGDLDREGYARILSDETIIVLLQSEMTDPPADRAVIDLGAWGSWRVAAREPSHNPVEWHVRCTRIRT